MAVHARRRLAARLVLGLAVLLGGCSKEDTPEGDDGGTVASAESSDRFVEIEVKTVEGREVHTTARRFGSIVFLTVSDESLRSAACRVGKKYEFAQQGPRVTVRVDGAPPELVGVVVEEPEGVAALREALDEGAPLLTIWCQAGTLGSFPPLPEGREVYLAVADRLSDLSLLPASGSVRGLGLYDCTGVTDLAPLRRLSGLRQMTLNRCQTLLDLTPLTGLTSLARLSLANFEQVGDLASVAALPALQRLWLTQGEALADLRPVAGLVNLEELGLVECPNLSDLSALASLTGLRRLCLIDCERVADLSPVARLTALRELRAVGCRQVSDLAPLAQLADLRRLKLYGCPRVADLAPLRDLQARGVEMELDDELRERLEERAEPPPPRLPRPPKEKAEEKAPKAHAFPDKE